MIVGIIDVNHDVGVYVDHYELNLILFLFYVYICISITTSSNLFGIYFSQCIKQYGSQYSVKYFFII
jgi:multisubunit Na+/H+ antiporter MnhE subunit